MDPSDFDPSSIIAPANIPPASSRQQPPSSARQMPARPMPRQAAAHPESLAAQMRDSAEVQRQREAVKRWQSLYPVYFDVTRSSREGRRVGRKLAVKNPLAREVAEGAAALGLQVAFEPSKMHPKDWANPGRVKVRLRGEDGKVLVPDIQNSQCPQHARGRRNDWGRNGRFGMLTKEQRITCSSTSRSGYEHILRPRVHH